MKVILTKLWTITQVSTRQRLGAFGDKALESFNYALLKFLNQSLLGEHFKVIMSFENKT